MDGSLRKKEGQLLINLQAGVNKSGGGKIRLATTFPEIRHPADLNPWAEFSGVLDRGKSVSDRAHTRLNCCASFVS